MVHIIEKSKEKYDNNNNNFVFARMKNYNT